MQVYTGSKSKAGTDANVYINVFGDRGDTGVRPLKESRTNRNKFEKGKVGYQRMQWQSAFFFRLYHMILKSDGSASVLSVNS